MNKSMIFLNFPPLNIKGHTANVNSYFEVESCKKCKTFSLCFCQPLIATPGGLRDLSKEYFTF